MKIYIKVTIAFFALLFGVVVLMEIFSSQQKLRPFLLIDQVEETELAFHADISKLFNEFDQYSKVNETSLANRVITGQVKQQLVKSGLVLNETYITYSLYGSKTVSFYLAIHDTALFESSFIRLSNYFELEPSKVHSNLYTSQKSDLSVEKYSKYVKINWGKAASKEKPNKGRKSSPLYRALLQPPGSGVLNTTGTARLDSNDYVTFSYQYEKDIALKINWKVSKNHPLQRGEAPISIYPSQKNNVQAYSNVDTKKIQENTNSFLKEKAIRLIEKLPKAAQEILTLWNGQASLQMGGKTAKETIQYITEFDDDFNQIEKKVVKIDSVPDLGIYWGTDQPQNTFEALIRMPNLKIQKNKLQVALFPPLQIKQEDSSLKITTASADFIQDKNKNILFIKSENQIIRGEATINKLSKDVVQLKLKIKNPIIPDKITLSKFW